MRRIPGPALAAVAMVVTAIGCGNPALEQRFDCRENNLHRTVALLAECEAVRTQNLAGTVDALDRQHQRDVANTGQNPARVQRLLDEEVRRWRARLPAHERRLAEHLAGRPANIERTISEIAN